MSIEVVNVKNLSVGVDEELVYVGRWNKKFGESVLGNKFKIGVDGGRDEVIEKFRGWLWKEIKSGNKSVIGELRRIVQLVKSGKKVKLVCWCKPEGCHGDVIVRCVNWMIKEGY